MERYIETFDFKIESTRSQKSSFFNQNPFEKYFFVLTHFTALDTKSHVFM